MLSMAAPSRPAIESTLILGNFCADSRSGMVFVTTTCSRRELGDSVNSRARKHGVAGGSVDGGGAGFVQSVDGFYQRAGGVNDVVNNEASLAFYVTNYVHHFGHINIGAALIHDCQRGAHLLREESCALHAACIRRNHGQVGQSKLAEVAHQNGAGK